MRKNIDEYVSKRQKYYDEKRKFETALEGVQLEKGDVFAMIIAAFSTILPFAIGFFLCLFLLMKLIFRF